MILEFGPSPATTTTQCPACGGDGLIEIDAYRGGEQPETRLCQLCGGVPASDQPTQTKPLGDTKRTWPKFVNAKHAHNYQNAQWDETRERIRLQCSMCREALFFSTSCQLLEGDAPPNIEELSSRVAKFHLARKAQMREGK